MFHPFRNRWLAHECERRLLSFAGEMENLRPELKQKLSGQEAERKTLNAATPLAEGQHVDEFVNRCNTYLQEYGKKAEALPSSFRDNYEARIAAFFRGSFDRYDANHNRVTEHSEFDTYATQMYERMQKTLEAYLPQEGEAKVGAETQRPQEQAKEAADAAQHVEIPREEFNEQDLQTTGGVEREMQKFGRQSQRLQNAGQTLSRSMADFQTSYEQFEKNKRGLDAMGGPVGAAVGFLIPGLPNPFSRGSSFLGIELRKDPETERMREQHEALKKQVAIKLAVFRAEKYRVDAFGTKLNATGETLRKSENTGHAERVDKAAKQQVELQGQEKTGREHLEQMQKTRKQMEEQRQQLVKYRDDLVQQQDKAREAGRNTELQSGQLEQTNKTMNDALAQVRDALGNPGISEEQRTQLQQRQDEILGRQQRVEQGIKQLAGGGVQLNEAEQKISTERGRLDQNFFDLQHHVDEIVNPTIVSLEESIKSVQELRPQVEGQAKSLNTQHEETLSVIDQLDTGIGEQVLGSALATDQLVGALQQQQKSLNELDIKPPSFWETSAIGLTMHHLSEGVQWLSKQVFENGIFKITGWLKSLQIKTGIEAFDTALNMIKNTAINVYVDLPLGLAEAAIGLVGGIAHIIAHPVDALVGLGAMIGRDPKTGEWLWTDMGNREKWAKLGETWGALVGWEHLSKGEFGRGVGHAALNILMTATGAGAAGTGASVAARAAGMAGRIAQAGRIGRIGLYAQAIVRNPGAFLRVTGSELATNAVPNAVGFVRHIAEAPLNLVRMGQRMAMPTGARIAADITAVEGQMGRLATSAVRVNGRALGDLGLTLEDAGRLAPGRLQELFGVAQNDIRGLHGIVRLERQASELANLRMARQALEIEQVNPGLRDVASLRGEKLDQFIESQNLRMDTNPAEYVNQLGRRQGLRGAELDRFVAEFRVTDRAGQVVHATEEGVVAFDAAGRLQVLRDPRAITSFIEESARMRGVPANAVRIEVAEKMLGRRLSLPNGRLTAEGMEIIRAHEVGGDIASLTTGQKVVKGRILMRSFEAEYVARGVPRELAREFARRDAQVLMDRGIAARPQVAEIGRAAMPRPMTLDTLNGLRGQTVDVVYTNSVGVSTRGRATIKGPGARSGTMEIEFRGADGSTFGGTVEAGELRLLPRSTNAASAAPRPVAPATPRNSPRTAPEAPAESVIAPRPSPSVDAALSRRFRGMNDAELESTAAGLRNKWRDINRQIAREADPAALTNLRHEATSIERELQQAEISRSIHRTNVEHGSGTSPFQRNRQHEMQPVHVDVERGVIGRMRDTLGGGNRSRVLTKDADRVFLGRSKDGTQVLVGRWDSARGVFQTEVYECGSTFVNDMQEFARIRRIGSQELTRQERGLAARRTQLTPEEAELWENLRAECRYRLERGDPVLRAVDEAATPSRTVAAAPTATTSPRPAAAPTAAPTAGPTATARTAPWRSTSEAGYAWRQSLDRGQYLRAPLRAASVFVGEALGLRTIGRWWRGRVKDIPGIQANIDRLRPSANLGDTVAAARIVKLEKQIVDIQGRFRIRLAQRPKPKWPAREPSPTGASGEAATAGEALGPPLPEHIRIQRELASRRNNPGSRPGENQVRIVELEKQLRDLEAGRPAPAPTPSTIPLESPPPVGTNVPPAPTARFDVGLGVPERAPAASVLPTATEGAAKSVTASAAEGGSGLVARLEARGNRPVTLRRPDGTSERLVYVRQEGDRLVFRPIDAVDGAAEVSFTERSLRITRPERTPTAVRGLNTADVDQLSRLGERPITLRRPDGTSERLVYVRQEGDRVFFRPINAADGATEVSFSARSLNLRRRPRQAAGSPATPARETVLDSGGAATRDTVLDRSAPRPGIPEPSPPRPGSPMNVRHLAAVERRLNRGETVTMWLDRNTPVTVEGVDLTAKTLRVRMPDGTLVDRPLNGLRAVPRRPRPAPRNRNPRQTTTPRPEEGATSDWFEMDGEAAVADTNVTRPSNSRARQGEAPRSTVARGEEWVPAEDVVLLDESGAPAARGAAGHDAVLEFDGPNAQLGTLETDVVPSPATPAPSARRNAQLGPEPANPRTGVREASAPRAESVPAVTPEIAALETRVADAARVAHMPEAARMLSEPVLSDALREVSGSRGGVAVHGVTDVHNPSIYHDVSSNGRLSRAAPVRFGDGEITQAIRRGNEVEAVELSQSGGRAVLTYRYGHPQFTETGTAAGRHVQMQVDVSLSEATARRVYEFLQTNPDYARTFFVASAEIPGAPAAYLAGMRQNFARAPFGQQARGMRGIAFAEARGSNPPASRVMVRNGARWEEAAPGVLGM